MCASNFERVKCFHLNFQRPIRNQPTMLTQRERFLRIDLIEEETEELWQAMDDEDLIGTADALADLAYVVYGTAVEMGINLDKVFAEVHRSNMSKMGADGKPVLRSDGKVMKGPNYKPPDITNALR